MNSRSEPSRSVPIKVAYLFTGFRGEAWKKAEEGTGDKNGFWGMSYLSLYGVEPRLVEVESFYPRWLTKFFRRHVFSVNTIHLPVFLALFAYDIVYTSTGFASQLLMALLRFVGIHRPLWVMHDFSITGYLQHRNMFRRALFRFLVSRADGIVTLSTKEVKMLEEKFPHLKGKIAWIPFGRDITSFTPLDIPEVLQVFVPGKDPDRDLQTVFQACEGLGVKVIVTTYPARLKIFGALSSFVEHRELTTEEMIEEYSRSAIVVIPLDTSSGLNDAMGMSVVTEALAAGRPIVASNTHTMASYITDGENGLLVDEHNVDQMRDAIKRLLEEPALRERLGKNARAYALLNLDADRQGEKLASFFKRLLSGRE